MSDDRRAELIDHFRELSFDCNCDDCLDIESVLQHEHTQPQEPPEVPEIDDALSQLEFLRDKTYFGGVFASTINRAIAGLPQEPPEGWKRVRMAVAADDSGRVGSFGINVGERIDMAIFLAADQVAPVCHQAIIVANIPPVAVPEVVGKVEVQP